MKIALIGFGSVGQGFVEILRDKADYLRAAYGFEVQLVAVATRTRGSLVVPPGAHGSLDPTALLDAIAAGSLYKLPDAAQFERGWDAERIARESDADVLIEAGPTNLETGQPALSICEAALSAGKHIVLANKGPVAVAYDQLQRAANAAGCLLRFEGTVMAGTPSIRLAQEGLAGCDITEARGILNGTTNTMLSMMEAGSSYDDALAEAQRLGYAEADPTADVDGWDAAGKAIILSWLLFGKALTLAQMDVTGIRMLTPEDIAEAKAAGERWKLIARVSPQGGSVTPMRLPLSHPLAGVGGATNAITYTTDLLGDVTLIGAGAGGQQTGFALLSDVLSIHRATGGASAG